jgi:hypothetical protein
MIARQRRKRLDRILDMRSVRALVCCTNSNVQIIWPHDGGECAIHLGLRLKLTTTDQTYPAHVSLRSPMLAPKYNASSSMATSPSHCTPLAKSTSCVGPLSDQVAPRKRDRAGTSRATHRLKNRLPGLEQRHHFIHALIPWVSVCRRKSNSKKFRSSSHTHK